MQAPCQLHGLTLEQQRVVRAIGKATEVAKEFHDDQPKYKSIKIRFSR